MYEYKNQLLVRTDRGYEIVSLQLNEDGSYEIIPSGKKYNSRPKGATHTNVQNVITQYGMVAGDTYPTVAAESGKSGSEGQHKGHEGSDE